MTWVFCDSYRPHLAWRGPVEILVGIEPRLCSGTPESSDSRGVGSGNADASAFRGLGARQIPAWCCQGWRWSGRFSQAVCEQYVPRARSWRSEASRDASGAGHLGRGVAQSRR